MVVDESVLGSLRVPRPAGGQLFAAALAAGARTALPVPAPDLVVGELDAADARRCTLDRAHHVVAPARN